MAPRNKVPKSPRSRPSATVPEGKRVYLLERAGGKPLTKVVLPADWRVTFGSVTVGHGKSGGSYPGGMGWCFRAYAGPEDPRVVYTDVMGFREITVEVQERHRTATRRTLERDTGGLKAGSVVEAVTHEWAEPDVDRRSPQNIDHAAKQLSASFDTASAAVVEEF